MILSVLEFLQKCNVVMDLLVLLKWFSIPYQSTRMLLLELSFDLFAAWDISASNDSSAQNTGWKTI